METAAEPNVPRGRGVPPTGTQETGLDPVRNVRAGPPEHQYVRHTFSRDFAVNATVNTYDVGFRMTSVYDPMVKSTAASNITTAGGGTTTTYYPVSAEPDDSIGSARWYGMYAAMYDYYHVVGCRWHVTVENLKTDPMWVHAMYYTTQLPSRYATNLDMLEWNDCESHRIAESAWSITTNGQKEANATAYGDVRDENDVPSTTDNYQNGNMIAAKGKNTLTLSGHYAPGQFHRLIQQDSTAATWTAVGSNPNLTERLLLRFKPDINSVQATSASVYDREITLRVIIHLEYLCEWKQLKELLHRPIA